MLILPDDFVFGAATAAYQVEGATDIGNKGRVLWDHHLEQLGKTSADVACDFYHKYPQDLQLCHDFGIHALRISIAWTRLFPSGSGHPEPDGVAFYHRVFAKCHELNITPYVTLHHFDSPERIFADGDWLNPVNIDKFVDYANFCFKEYHMEVDHWITINEPTTLAKQQNISGTFPPGIKYDFNRCFQQQHNMNIANARIVMLFKKNYSGKIGIVHALQTIYPNTNTDADLLAAHRQDILENKFLLDGTLGGTYSIDTVDTMNAILDANHQKYIQINNNDTSLLKEAAKKIDFIGINYYYSKFISQYDGKSEFIHNGTGNKGSSVAQLHGVGREVKHPELPSTDWDWSIYPKGLKDQLVRLHHDYPNIPAFYITENGIGLKEALAVDKHTIQDTKRIDYLKQHIQATADAIKLGVPVRGFFVWSLMDLFSWTNGYKKRYGLFYTDFNTLKRYPKQSAFWYRDIATTHKLEE